MHYENVTGFIGKGLQKLSQMNKNSDEFKTCLAWLSGYVSHLVVDSFMHPVINCIVNGIYIFTHVEHCHCELIQDTYIFNKSTGTDIIKAAPKDQGTFGYLNIPDDCSNPNDPDRIHPYIGAFWLDLLRTAHPHAVHTRMVADGMFSVMLCDKEDKFKEMEDFSCNEQRVEILSFEIAPKAECQFEANWEDKIRPYCPGFKAPGGHGIQKGQ